MSDKEIFDLKFVHIVWNDSLNGKSGFYGDNIYDLQQHVENNAQGFYCIISKADNVRKPFMDDKADVISSWRFFYYDPNYECKRAYEQGKTIQCRNKGDDKWMVTSNPKWLDTCEYRVKPEKKWRPFKDVAELKQTWLAKNGAKSKGDLYEPFIWVRDKKRPDITRLITGFNGGCQCVAIAGQWHILEGLFDDYEFLDGTPCGVEE